MTPQGFWCRLLRRHRGRVWSGVHGKSWRCNHCGETHPLTKANR